MRILLLVLISVTLFGCKKDKMFPDSSGGLFGDIPPIQAEPSFTFYPTSDAYWITKSYLNTPIGTFHFIDTLSLGTYVNMNTRTLDPNVNLWSAADPSSNKKYQEVIVNAMQVSPGNDTTYSQHSGGWFRQDSISKKIYTPRENPYTNLWYEDLQLDFDLEVGDPADFYDHSYVVKEVDSVAFGDMYLKRIWYGLPSSTSGFRSILQAFDIRYSGSVGHPAGNQGWMKFVFGEHSIQF